MDKDAEREDAEVEQVTREEAVAEGGVGDIWRMGRDEDAFACWHLQPLPFQDHQASAIGDIDEEGVRVLPRRREHAINEGNAGIGWKRLRGRRKELGTVGV
ncbi:MAG: hypothetical protein PVTTEEND_001190 [Candidatus Fervidibacter sp.]